MKIFQTLAFLAIFAVAADASTNPYAHLKPTSVSNSTAGVKTPCPRNNNTTMNTQPKKPRRCPDICTKEFKPVCGSDGKTYSNACMLKTAICKSQKTKLRLRKAHDGPCKSNTPIPVAPSKPTGPNDETPVAPADAEGKNPPAPAPAPVPVPAPASSANGTTNTNGKNPPLPVTPDTLNDKNPRATDPKKSTTGSDSDDSYESKASADRKKPSSPESSGSKPLAGGNPTPRSINNNSNGNNSPATAPCPTRAVPAPVNNSTA